MSDIFENDQTALYEISKRTDNVESEIKDIREKLHNHYSDQVGLMIAIQEIDNNIISINESLSRIYENQKNNSQKSIDLEKAYDLRIEQLEETHTKIKMVFSSWKVVIILGTLFILIGVGLDDILRAALPENTVKERQEVINK